MVRCQRLDAAWQRAKRVAATIHESPNTNNGTGMRGFVVRDPDGYYVTINEARDEADTPLVG